jgi:hypothetical protein
MMGLQKIIDKLNEIKSSLENLKNKSHKEGKEEFESKRELLNRIIDRLYSEKTAKELKDKLIHKFWVITGNESDEYWQNFYLIKIDLSLNVIDTILQEQSLFEENLNPEPKEFDFKKICEEKNE